MKKQGKAGQQGGGAKKKEASAEYRPFDKLKGLRDALEKKDQQPAPAAKGEKDPKKASAPRRDASPAPQAGKPTDDDEALALYRMMSGVVPLGGKQAKRLPKSQAALATSNIEAMRAEAYLPLQAEEDAARARLHALVEGGGEFEVQDDGRRVEGRRHGVSSATVRQLRRGELTIDARLDLHGETALTAPKVLEQFLRTQRVRGERCVLIVHGKGDHSPAHIGILRGEIAAWLSQGAAAAHVAAFTTADPNDGGEGAVYVLLER